MSNTQKIYVANGTEKFDGDLVEFSLNLTKLKSEAGEHIFDYNGDKYIKLKIAKKRDGADQYGKTHYVEVDTWNPEVKPEKKVDDLPF
jgi:hypothetical protein